MHAWCDVLVVGAGVAGLAAAEAAAAGGARVIIADENPRFGGLADIAGGTIDGGPQLDWANERIRALAASDRKRARSGAHHRGRALPPQLCSAASSAWPIMTRRCWPRGSPRHRLWKVRAKQIVLASGAIERPIPFANNDRPGIMLASTVRGLIERWGVAPGLVGAVFTNNDDAYRTAIALKTAGVGLAQGHRLPGGPARPAHRRRPRDGHRGFVWHGHRRGGHDVGRQGGYRGEGFALSAGRGRVVSESRIACDFVAVSGGWNPAVHLWCHNGGKLALTRACRPSVPTSTRTASRGRRSQRSVRARCLHCARP
jgi:sarcosine oxidase, subunit alpha